MRLNKKLKAGFTLIELLVVIAIIALLAAIVLVSLNSARAKAKDAKIGGQLSEMRAQAELFYSDFGAYSGSGTACDPGAPAVPGSTNMFERPASENGLWELFTAVDNDNGAGNVYCKSSSGSWAAHADLVTGGTWCVDSNGFSGKGKVLYGTGTNTDPYICR